MRQQILTVSTHVDVDAVHAEAGLLVDIVLIFVCLFCLEAAFFDPRLDYLLACHVSCTSSYSDPQIFGSDAGHVGGEQKPEGIDDAKLKAMKNVETTQHTTSAISFRHAHST